VYDRREGIELAIRSGNSSYWTPLQLHYYSHNDTFTGIEVIRGHSTEVTGNVLGIASKEVTVCGDLLRKQDVQFRWMGSAYFETPAGENVARFDSWALTNVTASLVTERGTVTLFEDTFGSEVLK
jgi:hypothetical protein